MGLFLVFVEERSCRLLRTKSDVVLGPPSAGYKWTIAAPFDATVGVNGLRPAARLLF
jgi:hypothetical protein